ncbi:hypothetical protein LUZ60_010339 [Juncus effusus]|nr:hypothetical protein LUZ60_010339 [Juncus effusus]
MEGQNTIDSRAVNINHEIEEEEQEQVETTLAVAEAELKARAVAAIEEEEYQVEMGPKRMPMDPRLHMAATKGDKHLLEQLLISVQAEAYAREGEVMINVTNTTSSCLLGVTYAGETALHLAARFGHFKLAEMICNENRSLLTKLNTKFETPLHYAAKAGCHRLISFFITLASEEGGNVEKFLRQKNKHGETALYQAILYRHATVVEELVKVDPGLAIIADNEHVSPLYLAVLQGYLPIVTTLVGLLRDNVSQSAYGGPDGQTALHAASLRDRDILQQVLYWKPELANVVDKSGNTPLHYAASQNLPKSVKVLLKKDISPAYTSDFLGLFPVHVAAKLGHVEVIERLFKKCPDSDKLLDGQGRNFLHIAVEEKREAIVSWACKHSNLIEPLNAQDDEGNTPMHLAVKAKNLEIFSHLLGNEKVHLGITNKNRLTPGDLVNTELFNPGLSWQNANLNIIRNAFSLVECCHSIHRVDHFIGQQNPDPEKEEEMAKSVAIISSLIASAAVSTMFVVSKAYKPDGDCRDGLSGAFLLFIFINSYTFLSSITATVSAVKASLSISDPTYRRLNLEGSNESIDMLSTGFLVAFALGVYVVVRPVSKWLAILVCVVSSIVIVWEPDKNESTLITRAVLVRKRSGAASLMHSPVGRAIMRQCSPISNFKYAYAYLIANIVLSDGNWCRSAGQNIIWPSIVSMVLAFYLAIIDIAGRQFSVIWTRLHSVASLYIIGQNEKIQRENKELRKGKKE